jgi:hypothetical protein
MQTNISLRSQPLPSAPPLPGAETSLSLKSEDPSAQPIDLSKQSIKIKKVSEGVFFAKVNLKDCSSFSVRLTNPAPDARGPKSEVTIDLAKIKELGGDNLEDAVIAVRVGANNELEVSLVSDSEMDKKGLAAQIKPALDTNHLVCMRTQTQGANVINYDLLMQGQASDHPANLINRSAGDLRTTNRDVENHLSYLIWFKSDLIDVGSSQPAHKKTVDEWQFKLYAMFEKGKKILDEMDEKDPGLIGHIQFAKTVFDHLAKVKLHNLEALRGKDFSPVETAYKELVAIVPNWIGDPPVLENKDGLDEAIKEFRSTLHTFNQILIPFLHDPSADERQAKKLVD